MRLVRVTGGCGEIRERATRMPLVGGSRQALEPADPLHRLRAQTGLREEQAPEVPLGDPELTRDRGHIACRTRGSTGDGRSAARKVPAHTCSATCVAIRSGSTADRGRATNGTRRGPKVRFPRFKGKRHGMSCRFTGAFGLAEGDRRHVTLPRIGVVRAHESTRTLARHVERGTARIRSATVSSRGGRVLLVLGEITRNDPAPRRLEATVGVDLGIKSLAVLSTGEIVPNPKHLEIALRELRRLQR